MRFTHLWLVLIGCTTPGLTPAPALDAGSTSGTCPVPRVRDGGAPATIYDFVLTELTIDENTSHTMPHTGFNLDGRFSTAPLAPGDCDQRDFFSALDPDQNQNGCTGDTLDCRGGVDNQLPELAGTVMMGVDLRRGLRSEVALGRLVRVVRLIGLDAPPGEVVNDDEVFVEIHRGIPMFQDCSQIGTPGRPYALDGRTTAGAQGSLLFCGRAHVVNGRLRTVDDPQLALSALPLPFSPGYLDFPLTAYHARLGVTLAAEQGTLGNLGGMVLPDELRPAILTIVSFPAVFRGTLEGLAMALVDVQTMNSCDAPNGGVGIGYGFQMVRATVLPQPEMGPSPGMCGAN